MGTNGAAGGGPRAHTWALVEELVRSERGAVLRAEVARLTGAPAVLVEDVLQDSCERLCRGECRGRSMGQVYQWLFKATLHQVEKVRDRGQLRHEVLVDWSSADHTEHVPAAAAADVEVLASERERELEKLVATLVEGLDDRQRRVAVLHSHGLRGREIARRLQTTERTVKRLKKRTLARARETLVRAAGGGCQQGELLISRYSFGLASPGGCFAAQLHLASCGQCATLYRRLELAHETIAALLPTPAVVEADPALLERATHKTADALAQVKQQLAETTGLAKQHATASYARAAEYTPLASVRPGAAATAIAGCLALAGGTATYCVENNLNPVSGIAGLVRAEAAKPRPQRPPTKTRAAQQTPDPPPVIPEPAAAQPLEAEPPPVASPSPAPDPPPAPPPPAPEPTPPGEQFGEPATAASLPAPAPRPAQPAPVPESGGTDLYGP